MIQRVIEFIRQLLEAFKSLLPGGGDEGRPQGKRRNPWPQCPLCFLRVPALCTDAEEGAEPCGNGLSCGCCYGPHHTEKGADRDGGKFTTSAERA